MTDLLLRMIPKHSITEIIDIIYRSYPIISKIIDQLILINHLYLYIESSVTVFPSEFTLPLTNITNTCFLWLVRVHVPVICNLVRIYKVHLVRIHLVKIKIKWAFVILLYVTECNLVRIQQHVNINNFVFATNTDHKQVFLFKSLT